MEIRSTSKEAREDMIIIDTREQKPLWNKKYNPHLILEKLDEGDYTTPELKGIAHIERKSPIDLYGSIIQNHERFRDELKRANEKGIRLAVFVECEHDTFFGKLFHRGNTLKTPSSTLRKIVATMTKKYNTEFVWCKGRVDMKNKMCLWFVERKSELDIRNKEENKPKASFVVHDVQNRQIPENLEVEPKEKVKWG